MSQLVILQRVARRQSHTLRYQLCARSFYACLVSPKEHTSSMEVDTVSPLFTYTALRLWKVK